jgi:riboflavin kinase/FMN adenylyltransferase
MRTQVFRFQPFLENFAGSGKKEACSVAVGNFDGLHLGHQALLRSLVDRAAASGHRARVVSFYPHPAKVLGKEKSLLPLSSFHERIHVLSNLGIHDYVLIRFCRRLSEMSGEEFLQKILLDALGCRDLTVGPDFRIGYGRAFGIEEISKFLLQRSCTLTCFPFLEFPSQQKIGSRLIRDMLSEGQCDEAALALGRPYKLRGRVIPGEGRGRTIGYPTANIGAGKQFLPGQGVYPCILELEGNSYHSVANIGKRPSFERDGQVKTEVHVFDERLPKQSDFYGRRVSIRFFSKMREEKKFPSVHELISQLQKDVLHAKTLLQTFERDSK